MKKLINPILILCFVATIATLKAQESRKLDYFDAISVAGDLTVTLVAGGEHRAVLEAEGGITEDDVTMYVKGKTLKVQLIEGLLHDERHADITITYTELRSVKATAGAQVQTTGPIVGSELALRVGSGAQMQAEVAVEALNAWVSEGGQLAVSGTTTDQEVNASTGGVYEGFELECMRTYVKSNTGGEAEVVANQRLDANANTGGSIRYKGEPEEKQMRSLISGGIRNVN